MFAWEYVQGLEADSRVGKGLKERYVALAHGTAPFMPCTLFDLHCTESYSLVIAAGLQSLFLNR